MATVRIYYSRSDNKQQDYNIFWWSEEYEDDHTGLLFPLINRQKVNFNSDNYVDLDIGNHKAIKWYIKRKDNDFDHNKELCNAIVNGEQTFACGPLCLYCYDTGYHWQLDITVSPQTSFYINNTSPYLYKDSSYTDILPMSLALAGDSTLDGDGDNTVGVDATVFRITYTVSDWLDVDIPEEEIWSVKWAKYSEYYKTTINRIQLLYLLNKSYTIGENDMQLSIDADALQAEKDDAKQMLEKAVANCLYKLGEDIAAFDEDAFLADVDAYKATKSASLVLVVDYLEETLNSLANLA